MAVVELEVTDDAVHLWLDRPEKHNALSLDVITRIDEALDAVWDSDLPLFVRSRTPGMFIAGADVAALRSRTVREGITGPYDRVYARFAEYPMPTVAVVDGPAFGGGFELALACDLRIGTAGSLWALPETQLGLVPAAGGMWRLERLVGRGKALEMVFTGTRLGGEEALRLGLLQRLADAEQLDEAVQTLARQLRRASPLSLVLAKRCMADDRAESPDAHTLAQVVCTVSEDTRGRLDRFLARNRSDAAGLRQWTVGEFTITRIVEKIADMPLDRLLPDADPEAAAGLAWTAWGSLAAPGVARMSFHSFLIESPDGKVLVDTGYGNEKDRPGRPHAHMLDLPFLEDLRRAGAAPQDITHVVCTHLHLDHVGWNTRRDEQQSWVPTFSAAEYWMSSEEYHHWASRAARADGDDIAQSNAFRDSVAPLAATGRLQLTDGPVEILPGVEILPSPGHTPGHVCVRVSSGGEAALLVGDALQHPAQVAFPEWGGRVDADPAAAVRSRRAILDLAADGRTLTLGGHWAGTTGLVLSRAEDGSIQCAEG